MNWHILIPCIIVLVIVILCILPVGVVIRYEEHLELRVRVAFLTFKLPPEEELRRRRAGKRRPLPPLRDFLSPALDALEMLARKVRIDNLVIHYTAAAEDPASAALQYGAVSAGLHILVARLEAASRLRKRDIRMDADFERTKPKIRALVSLSMRLWQAVVLAVRFGKKYIRQKREREAREAARKGKPIQAAARANGKESQHG